MTEENNNLSSKLEASLNYDNTFLKIAELLEKARKTTAQAINAFMTSTYWEIGRCIVEFEQNGEKRAQYGKGLLKRLSLDLTSKFGRGFSERNLEQMRVFYLEWPIPQTLPAKSQNILVDGTTNQLYLTHNFSLPWSHYVRLMSVKNNDARKFYETETLRCGWSIRQLDRQISSQFYERTALSKNKAAMLQKATQASPEDLITPEEEIKDPFVLEFLNLKDEYSENDLEEALLQQLENFLLELGNDFTFVGRQKRLRIGEEWYRIDLLFFHRRLRSLIIIDLKLGKFSHADAGQMHMYLNYVRQHWTLKDENPPIGLILCAEKDNALAHYALEGLPNKVMAAEYKTTLPDEKILVDELERTSKLLRERKLLSLKLDSEHDS